MGGIIRRVWDDAADGPFVRPKDPPEIYEYLERLLPLTLVDQIGPAEAVLRTLPAEEGWELQSADGRPFFRDERAQLAVFRYRRPLSEALRGTRNYQPDPE